MTESSRPTWCDIDLAALERNYRAIEHVVGESKMMPVIKADAYGHGLIQIGSRLQDIGAPVWQLPTSKRAWPFELAESRFQFRCLEGQ